MAGKARTITRDDDVVERAPPREAQDNRTPEGQRDPNKIYTRSGREISGIRYTGNEDRFDFDRSIIPAGWDYQWKTKTVKNWEWIDHQVELAANGWEPVPAERHPGVFMPAGYTGPVERGGLVLMERDMRLTAQARSMERRAADSQLGISRSMAGLMNRQMPGGSGILDFEHPAAQSATFRKVDRAPAVGDGRYTYESDDE